MSNPEEFENEIRAVKEAVPDADESAIANEFTRYRDDFLVPPKHAPVSYTHLTLPTTPYV